MSGIKSWLPNVLVLGSLGGIAVWGHETDWTFTKWAHHGPAHRHDESHAPAAPEPHSGVVEFNSSEALTTAGVKVEVVTARAMEEYVTAHGVVTYPLDSLAELAARVPGVVWQVRKQLGDVVHKGEVLALLDAAAVGEAKADFLQAMVHAELKEETVLRLRDAGDAVPLRQRREAEAQWRESRVLRFNAQQRLINLGLVIHHEELTDLSDEERGAHIHFLGLPKEICGSLDPATTTANLLPLVAPFDGVLIRREMVVGEQASPESKQLVVANLDQMWLKLNVSKEDSPRLAVGQELQFEADGLPEKATTRIGWINSEVDDKTRTVQVLATVMNPMRQGVNGPSRLLKSNTFGLARIQVRHSESALVVPETAVQRDGKSSVVFVATELQTNGEPATWQFEPRAVVAGPTSGGFTEVIQGLQAGERVATSGSHILKSEMANRVAQTTP